MAGEATEVVDSVEDDAAFDAAFGSINAQTHTPDAADEPEDAAPAAQAVTEAAAPAPEPEYVQITRGDWEAAQQRLSGLDPADLKRRLDSAHGQLGGMKQKLETLSKGGALEFKVEDFAELKDEYGEDFVKNYVAGLNRGSSRLRPAADMGEQPTQPTTTPVADAKPAFDPVKRDLLLNDVVDGDWVAVINTPAFGAWRTSQPAEVQALAGSDDVADASRMLRLYRKHQATPAPVASPAPAVAPVPPAPRPTSTRQRVLTAAVSPRGTGGHATAPSEDDEFDNAFHGKR